MSPLRRFGIKISGTVNESSSLLEKRRKVGVINTGSSNLSAVLRSLSKAGFLAQMVPLGGSGSDEYECLVLPGVGNFGFVMGELEKSGTSSWLRSVYLSGTPILGICLGAQLLFDSSEEAPGVKGFGFIQGSVQKLESDEVARVPHMGWNEVSVIESMGSYFDALAGKSFYFAHSFFFAPSRTSDIVALAWHGKPFCAIAGNSRCLAIQFHPEKSGRAGQEMLRRAVEWLCRVDSRNV
jgi:glutamine amidotransferase